MPGPVAKLNLPLLPGFQDSKQDYAIDYGGSLIKLIYRTKTGTNSEESGLSVAIFPHGDLDGLASFVKENVATTDIKSPVHTTGVGIKKDGPQMEKLFGRKLKHYNEMDTFSKASKVIFPKLSSDQLFWPLPKQEFCYSLKMTRAFLQMQKTIKENEMMEEDFLVMTETPFVKKLLSESDDALYQEYVSKPLEKADPGVIVMCSSGLACYKVKEDFGLGALGYSPVGGRTLMGLGCLLTRAKNYDELMELAAKGDNSKVDVFVKHLKGGDKDDVYALFPDDMVCFNFGHAYGKTIDDFSREDLAAAVVFLMCLEVANFAFTTAQKANTNNVMLCGTIANHEVTRKYITQGFLMQTFEQQSDITLRLCKLGPYFGAIGCWIYGMEAEK